MVESRIKVPWYALLALVECSSKINEELGGTGALDEEFTNKPQGYRAAYFHMRMLNEIHCFHFNI